MNTRKLSWFMSLVLVAAVVAWSSGDAVAQKQATTGDVAKKFNKVAPAEQKAAAKRAKKLGLKPGVGGRHHGVGGRHHKGVKPRGAESSAATRAIESLVATAKAVAQAIGSLGASTAYAASAPILPGIEGPGGIPHYFGPYGNWAYSPLPRGAIGTITVDSGGTGYTAPTVAILDAYGTVDVLATADAVVDPATGAITGINVTNPGSGYSAPIVEITDSSGVDAAATANLTGLTGGMRKFVDRMPGLTAAGANGLGQSVPLGVADTTTYPGSDYYEIALIEFSEQLHSDLAPTRLRGYVQIEKPGSATIPAGSAHVLLPGIFINGVQVYGYDNPHYLGPTIVAKGRAHGVPGGLGGDPTPVRVKLYNLLPTGAGGDLFLPVDETIPGAGLGPALPGSAGDRFTQNRATIHLHGNNTVWISDGNVHMWITPPNENTPYPRGVSVRNVPDMLDSTGAVDCDAAGSGCQTFFYTNAQSARLQFYHDHAIAITRLNVYAGEAAGYVITDAVEQDMINGTNVSGVNINCDANGINCAKVLPDIGIPLVIQDRTFVEADTIFAQDPTWNWGTGPRDPATGNITAAVDGDLWYPHVYMSAQNPWDLSGTNAFGRWHYGPWFNPPVPECVDGLPVGCIEVGPVPNEYYQADCDLVPPGPGCTDPWEPPLRPGTPNPSTPGEGFMDTPMVNGTAYPYLEVEPKAYRFRVLSAANDRMFNLQLYVAADKNSWQPAPGTPGVPGSPTVLCDAAFAGPLTDCTEVKMISVAGQPNQYADWPSGIPDPATKGPDWILIGTEGGLMPKPVKVPQQPVGWNLNPTTFNFGTVNQHSLLLGSAERADVVVDFSAYAGKTLILYNDAPAAFPAGVPTYDYFTGVPNQMDVGGAPTTQPGYGPNTRTIMQIRVAAAPPGTTPTAYDLAALQAVFAKGVNPDGTPNSSKRGVFELTQDPIIIPQAAYNSAYNNTFPATAAGQYIQIADTQKTFQPINENGALMPAVTLPLEMKAMHDEMGGVYDTMFGRMSGMLGLSNPTSPVHVLIPYGLASPPTDLVKGSVEGSPIGVLPDGTQIWRIFHNGVDTHTIHTHLFHAQLINRLGQDGVLLPTDPIELGWKDTFRVNPLEITYFAMRPTVPTPDVLPFEVPDSVRLIDPTLPEGATLVPPAPAGWFDPEGNQITEIPNHFVNFGWEYVWHCHILAHEEMDMMHSLVFAVPPRPPLITNATVTGPANNPTVDLTWTDNSIKEAGFTVQRASDFNFTTGLRSFNVAENAVGYSDTTVANNAAYWYRVLAIGNKVGDTATYPGSLGFPTMTADSASNIMPVVVGTPTTAVPADPTLLNATVQAGPQVRLTWRDNANNETGFVVERCTVVPPATSCSNFAQIAVTAAGGGAETYIDTAVTVGNTYFYQVWAVNALGRSVNPTNTDSATVPAVPAVPANFRVRAVKNATGPNYTATLTWASATNPTNFTIQRATNATFTANLRTFTPAGAARNLTQTVNRNTTYYYRIRANDSISGSSAWSNALPFPIRTGP